MPRHVCKRPWKATVCWLLKIEGLGQVSQVIKGVFKFRGDNSSLSPGNIAVAEIHKLTIGFMRCQSASQTASCSAFSYLLPLHVVLDEPLGSFRDATVQRLDRCPNVIVRVNRFTNIMQQGGSEEFLVVRMLVTGKVENLKAVIKCIPLGMVEFGLLHVFKW